MSSPHYDFTIENEELVIEFTLETAAAGTAVQALSQVLQTKEEIDEAKQEIDTIIPAINQLGTNVLEVIDQAGTSTLQAIGQEGTSKLQAIEQEGTSKLQAIEQEGNSKIQAIENTGTTAVQSVNQAKTEALGEIDPKVEQVTQAAQQVSQQSQQVTTDKGIIEGFKTDTETAAASILGKLNLTGTPAEGSIWQVVEGVGQPVSVASILQNKDVFAKSIVNESKKRVIIWDNFIRPQIFNQPNAWGIADSGETYISESGLNTSLLTSDMGRARFEVLGDSVRLDIPTGKKNTENNAGYEFNVGQRIQGTAQLSGMSFRLCRDEENYIEMDINLQLLNINICILNVKTNIASLNINSSDFDTRLGLSNKIRHFKFGFTRNSNLRAIIYCKNDLDPSLHAFLQTANIQSIFPNISDVNYIRFSERGQINPTSSYINYFSLSNT